MRRADRLFQIVQILKHRRLTTAQELADRLEVSTRTVYRDVQDLCLSGIPIEGEAGVGYLLRHEVWGGKELGSAARQAMIKVEAVLPKRLQAYQSLMFSPDFYLDSNEFQFLDPLRHASQRREYVKLFYQDANKALTEREVRPLAIYFWRGTWTLLTWCELRSDFRNFRVDRITGLLRLNRHFEPTPGQELEDYICLMENQS